MDIEESFFDGARGVVDAAYVTQAQQVLSSRSSLASRLMQSQRMPDEGWRERDVEWFLETCASMDSNNFAANVGVGEREGRVIAPLVTKLSVGLAHGVGRSGDIAAIQPKAAGSSLFAKLSNAMALDALQIAGLVEMKAAIVMPTATGLTLAICLLALRQKETQQQQQKKEKKKKKDVVIWLRIDQKSCLKGIALAGMEIAVVEATRDTTKGTAFTAKKKKKKTKDEEKPPGAADVSSPPHDVLGDELLTDAGAVEAKLLEVGSENVLAIVSTTSCFAPRAPDDVEAIGKLCAKYDVRHVVNNAYGVQCSVTCASISRAQRVAKVDLVIQSTDKNFLVPVGGAVIASGDPDLITHVAKCYPGRASATPTRDLFITLLHLGRSGWKSLLARREAVVDPFRAKLKALAEKRGERLLTCDHNRISCAVSLTTVGHDKNAITKFGSMLFTRCCSGARVVVPTIRFDDDQDDDQDGDDSRDGVPATTVAGITFKAFGSNSSTYHIPYFTVAVALGVDPPELDEFLKRLDKTFAQVHKQMAKSTRVEHNGGTVTPDVV
eukprot:CAMPEP_0118902776 /NCGR_PEP_ID=MMETSP1166-20130328/7917_1 /TAXON_ID=1104430 /ORGANISM="Chrysoreinhardia sp, Strain CCMP3193" /LENGTH=551 /DNA_ID=CAMNT_0006841991 /DNA_START=196 /DNA_END=1851 /DNA_ORIENTATION=+